MFVYKFQLESRGIRLLPFIEEAFYMDMNQR